MNILAVGRLTTLSSVVTASLVGLTLGFAYYFAINATDARVMRYGLIAALVVSIVANLAYMVTRTGVLIGGEIESWGAYRALVMRMERLVSMAPSRVTVSYIIISCASLPFVVIGLFIDMNWVLLGLAIQGLASYVSFLLFQPSQVLIAGANNTISRHLLRHVQRRLRPHRVVLLCSPNIDGASSTYSNVARSVFSEMLVEAIDVSRHVLIACTPEESEPRNSVLAELARQGAEDKALLVCDEAQIGESTVRSIDVDSLLKMISEQQWNREPLMEK